MPITLNQQMKLGELLIKYGVSSKEAYELARVAEEYDRSYIWKMYFDKNKAEVLKTINELRNKLYDPRTLSSQT